ncbi:hypothetical protein LDENG_00003050, partial [Lucifuga dentata]
ILTTFYRGSIESILSSCITVWFGNCKASDQKTLQQIVRSAEKIIQVPFPAITDIFHKHTLHCTTSIVAEHSHPCHGLFTLCHLAEDTEAYEPPPPDYRTVSSPRW